MASCAGDIIWQRNVRCIGAPELISHSNIHWPNPDISPHFQMTKTKLSRSMDTLLYMHMLRILKNNRNKLYFHLIPSPDELRIGLYCSPPPEGNQDALALLLRVLSCCPYFLYSLYIHVHTSKHVHLKQTFMFVSG